MPVADTANDLYKVDIQKRIKDIQALMGERGLDVYLGSRIRTMSPPRVSRRSSPLS